MNDESGESTVEEDVMDAGREEESELERLGEVDAVKHSNIFMTRL